MTQMSEASVVRKLQVRVDELEAGLEKADRLAEAVDVCWHRHHDHGAGIGGCADVALRLREFRGQQNPTLGERDA